MYQLEPVLFFWISVNRNSRICWASTAGVPKCRSIIAFNQSKCIYVTPLHVSPLWLQWCSHQVVDVCQHQYNSTYIKSLTRAWFPTRLLQSAGDWYMVILPPCGKKSHTELVKYAISGWKNKLPKSNWSGEPSVALGNTPQHGTGILPLTTHSLLTPLQLLAWYLQTPVCVFIFHVDFGPPSTCFHVLYFLKICIMLHSSSG